MSTIEQQLKNDFYQNSTIKKALSEENTEAAAVDIKFKAEKCSCTYCADKACDLSILEGRNRKNCNKRKDCIAVSVKSKQRDGSCEAPQSACNVLVMERIDGMSLQNLMDRRGRQIASGNLSGNRLGFGERFIPQVLAQLVHALLTAKRHPLHIKHNDLKHDGIRVEKS